MTLSRYHSIAWMWPRQPSWLTARQSAGYQAHRAKKNLLQDLIHAGLNGPDACLLCYR